MKITEFYQTEYLQSALYQSFRSIASYIDGLKPSSRKIIYTIDKANIHNKIKVSQLSSKVAEFTQYLHGEQSLSGVIVGLAQNFVGSNNKNLLSPDGNFGSRFIPEPSAGRYIYTKKSDVFDKIFDDRDSDILPDQWFEGEKIEYKYYAPILPLLLVNGSEGIGNGFAQKILPRKIEDLNHEIIKKLSNSKYVIKDIEPYYEGFNGFIKREDGKVIIYGNFKRASAATLEITEIPIGYNLASYLSVLDGLVEKKIIKDYDDYSENDEFSFIIKVTKEFLQKNDEEIYDILRLKKIITENFTCIDENNAIIEFNNEKELLDAFVDFRLKLYSKRKKAIIDSLNKKKLIIENRVRFINAIIDDSSIIMKKARKVVESFLSKNKYDKVDNSYAYLLSMSIFSFTKEKVEELETSLKDIKKEIEIISKKTPKTLWKEDLKRI